MGVAVVDPTLDIATGLAAVVAASGLVVVDDVDEVDEVDDVDEEVIEEDADEDNGLLPVLVTLEMPKEDADVLVGGEVDNLFAGEVPLLGGEVDSFPSPGGDVDEEDAECLEGEVAGLAGVEDILLGGEDMGLGGGGPVAGLGGGDDTELIVERGRVVVVDDDEGGDIIADLALPALLEVVLLLLA